MKAVILAGGFGTNLKPWPLRYGKLDFVLGSKPMIVHQSEPLQSIGVTELVVETNIPLQAISYCEQLWEAILGMKVTGFQDSGTLGTAGRLALVRDKIVDGSGEPFFVLYAEVIGEYHLSEMIKFHRSHGGEASVMVTKVDDERVVALDESTGQVEMFVGNKRNAGIYLFNPCVFGRIELGPNSIERDILPRIAAEKKLYAMDLRGFWLVIEEPLDYITALSLYLKSLREKDSSELDSGANIVGNVLVSGGAEIGEDCLIGPDVVIGRGCIIENGVKISRSVVQSRARIMQHAYVSGCIIGEGQTIGQRARVEGLVIGLE